MRIPFLLSFTPLLLVLCGISLPAEGGDLAWSDPAREVPPPAHAIGIPSRDPGLDALPGFVKPPAGYGEVAFYWWLGDPLTRERLQYQIDQLAGKGVMGLQINYAHTDRGGRSYGLTFPSDPPLFSEAWWELVGWFLQAAKQKGMAISLSDYTLGMGQGWFMDEVLRDNPDLVGMTLAQAGMQAGGGREVTWQATENTISVVAYRLEDGRVVPGSGVDLRGSLKGRDLRWTAPAGAWRIIAVRAVANPWSIDPMNPKTGPQIIQRFFQRFEDRNPGEAGKGLNFFFSDELEFGVHGNLWNARFAEEFRKRKGYDLLAELPALFVDIGPRTPKVRLDYRDVMVSLSEEGYFRPVYEWHRQRGMIYGCDHGGRGLNVAEFGDYFRTQRWMSGPGCDQPNLSKHLIKNKVASSIAHLYQRPRVWLEGYHSSGWDTSTEQLADATFANFITGQNLLTFHGLYYSTHGGWWEWAPPCNHFRMPYWKHMGPFMDCVQRLSYLLSQGHHRCDVAILYPVAPVEADMDGGQAVGAAFAAGERLYGQGIDFDFMDFESLARATIRDRQIEVSGEVYRVLVLPHMKALRHSTMQKAQEFYRKGGIVVAIGALPEASDRAGRDDPELAAMVKEVFGDGKSPQRSASGGVGMLAPDAGPIPAAMDAAFARDVRFAGAKSAPYFMHRRIGAREVYAIYRAARGAECTLRAQGKVELWDPWTGQTRELDAVAQTPEGTTLRLPLEESEVQVIVFSPGQAKIAPATAVAQGPAQVIAIDGEWEFEIRPSLDNRFGDFHWPPTPRLIGAEARRFRYADETEANRGCEKPDFDDGRWSVTTQSFGPKFMKLGPLPEGVDPAELDARLATLATVSAGEAVEVNGARHAWQPYEFSWRWGIENDPGHQGWHGLKEEMHDEFIALGALRQSGTDTSREAEKGGTRYYLWTTVATEKAGEARVLMGGVRPTAAWLNGQKLALNAGKVNVGAGANRLLIRYDKPGKAYFVVTTGGGADGGEDAETFSRATQWIWYPGEKIEADRFFRKTFELADVPAKARLRITCDNGYLVYLNGKRLGEGSRWETVQQYDASGAMVKGKNVLAVRAHNAGDSAGLIAELAMGERLEKRIATDGSWRCAKEESAGWLEAGFDDKAWAAAEKIAEFEGSLWAMHPLGPPRLEEAAPPPPANTHRDLAMRWHNDRGVLPFDVRPLADKPAGWYRFTAPPGLRGMTIAANGKVSAWVDGKAGEIEALDGRPDGVLMHRVRVKEPSGGCAKVALRIEQRRGDYGGAAIPEPIELDCGKGMIAPGDWSKIDGLACYSGGAWYARNVTLPADASRGRWVLDLGRVVSSAEVRVNGQVAGVKVAPPWKLDITALVKPGENRIEVVVYNTLANHYLTIPTRYRGSLESGLIGPVKLEAWGRP